MNTQEAITPAQTQAFSMGLLVNPAAILANQRESNHGLSQNVIPSPSPQEARVHYGLGSQQDPEDRTLLPLS